MYNKYFFSPTCVFAFKCHIKHVKQIIEVIGVFQVKKTLTISAKVLAMQIIPRISPNVSCPYALTHGGTAKKYLLLGKTPFARELYVNETGERGTCRDSNILTRNVQR